MCTKTPHGQRVLPTVKWLLERVGLELGDLHGLGVSLGPGSYTGLRVGLAAAKTLAWAQSLPLVGVPTLKAMAHPGSEVWPNDLVLPLMDARSGAVHAGFYQGGVERAASQSALVEEVARQALVLVAGREGMGIRPLGEGWVRHQEQWAELLGPALRVVPDWFPQGSAQGVACLAWQRLSRGEADDTLTLEPVYQAKGTPAW
jgi:tRNA threonylcarbamoyladenosine biosynthesis protein TsaB